MSVLYEQKDNIAILSLYRENGYNALNYETVSQLYNHLISIWNNKEINIVIITAKGEKVFTAGADLKERRQMNSEQVNLYLSKIRETYKVIESMPQVIIAAVNGICVGGGTEMILACDLRIAASHATFSLPEVKIGIIPGAGGTQRLVRVVGLGRAKEMILTGKPVTAQKAERIGLINEIIEDKNVVDRAIEISKVISKNAPLSLKEAKEAIHFAANVHNEEGFLFESKSYERLVSTRDRQEALEAFNEKREPKYLGI
ncbi:hypothetical protein BTR23_09490 [Alkalihalophilus pseudofirmus]|nr:hypothetical protein BTR23_09490 [Alkalihalophilus pseudofirmus]